MPKANQSRDEVIRHHCEEISTHLGALKQLLPKNDFMPGSPTEKLEIIGKFLKRIYIHYGGIPH